jgi:hypothetical protein
MAGGPRLSPIPLTGAPRFALFETWDSTVPSSSRISMNVAGSPPLGVTYASSSAKTPGASSRFPQVPPPLTGSSEGQNHGFHPSKPQKRANVCKIFHNTPCQADLASRKSPNPFHLLLVPAMYVHIRIPNNILFAHYSLPGARIFSCGRLLPCPFQAASRMLVEAQVG